MTWLFLGPGASLESLVPEVRFALEAARQDAAALKAAGRGGMEWGGVARLYPRRWDTTTGGHGEAEEGVPRPPTQPRAEARAEARAGSEEQRCAHVDAEHPDKAAYARCTWLWLYSSPRRAARLLQQSVLLGVSVGVAAVLEPVARSTEIWKELS